MNFNKRNTTITREDINSITGTKPINVSYYQQAFVHKSVLRFIEGKSYERYEFLGDSIVNLVVAKYIFNKYLEKDEGFLTRLRTKLVNGSTLAFLAKKINLNKFVIISQNVEQFGGRNNDRILEDIFEAFICALYKDLGFEITEYFIIKLIEEHINFEELEKDNNYKDILLRYCQQNMAITPQYKLLYSKNNKVFSSVVVIKDIEYEKGIGKNKKISEQEASKNTLIKLGVSINQ